MTVWVDAQLSPYISLWINDNFPHINAKSLRSIGLRDATDIEIYREAKEANVIIMSKDYDFVKLIELYGSPPKLIWITCGNTSNSQMCMILKSSLQQAIEILNNQEGIVEISNKTF